MQTLTYKYKVYKQNRNHERRLQEWFRTAAWIYNHAIALHKRYYRIYHKSISMYRLQSHLLKLRKSTYSQWKAIGSQSVQQICERINNGYKNFFNRTAKHLPTFKNWRKYRSVTFKQAGYTLNGNDLTVNALKLRLKLHLSRPIDGKVQTLSIKRDAVGDYWIIIAVRRNEESSERKPMTGKTAGFDFGMKHFLTQDNGTRIESPLALFNHLDELRRKSRNLSRKKKGSNGRNKAKLSLARFHRKISNIREDFQWKTAIRIVSEYDVICLETLNMKAMQKVWGRKINDLSFTSFVSKLSWLCAKYGKKFVQINKWEASSKTCSSCGYRAEEMPLNIRKWTCPECGTHHDRDINAAKNILRVGTSTPGRDSINPAMQVAADDARISLL